MKKTIFVTIFIFSISFCLFSKEKFTMVNPDLNDPQKEWSYGAKTTAVIGVPFVSEPVQVTYDGAIYTRYAELAFFYSDKSKPVMIRQRTFLNGWIPIIIGTWEEDNISYRLEIFSSAENSDENRLNSVQYVKFSAFNKSNINQTTTIGGFFRGSGEDYRLGATKEPISGRDLFKFENNSFFRNGKTIFSFSKGAVLESRMGDSYKKKYKAWRKKITNSSATGIVKYRKELAPGEKFSAFFKMKRVPEKNRDTKFIDETEYNTHYQTTKIFWEKLLNFNQFSIPEKRVNDSWKAAMVNLILATRTQDGTKRQGSGLPYDDLFLNDFVDMRMAYDVYGLTDFVKVNMPWLKNNQLENGLFIDKSLSHGKQILASHGQALYSMSHHAIIANDKKFAQDVFTQIQKATNWIINEHHKNSNGLLPPSTPYDNEMIKGCYTSHNLWATIGLRNAIRVATLLGKKEIAQKWQEEEKSYMLALNKAIDWTYNKSGYITAGLYEYITGEKARTGFVEYRTDQEWENNMLYYPTEVLQRDDPRIKITIDTIRERKYREGVMTYRNGQHLHQYITINQAHQYMAIGEQQQALTDMYHVLLHNGPTHEGFENLVDPWTNHTPYASCPPPHGWAAAKTALFIRNMMVREEGGKCGMEEENRGLVLFSLISPAWVKTGNTLLINKAPIEQGILSAKLKFTDNGFEVNINAEYRNKPAFIAIPIPWHKKVSSATSNKGKIKVVNGRIVFNSNISKIKVIWEDTDEANQQTYQDILKSYRSEFGFTPDREDYKTQKGKMKPFLTEKEMESDSGVLSFDTVKRAWLTEYKRRYELHVKNREEIEVISAPEIK